MEHQSFPSVYPSTSLILALSLGHRRSTNTFQFQTNVTYIQSKYTRHKDAVQNPTTGSTVKYAMADADVRVPPHVPHIKLQSHGLKVSVQGLGCLVLSAFYGLPKPESDMIALILHAVSSNVTFLNTSDMYGPFTIEILLSKNKFLQKIEADRKQWQAKKQKKSS